MDLVLDFGHDDDLECSLKDGDDDEQPASLWGSESI